MFCNKCGFNNAQGSVFCNKCGNKLIEAFIEQNNSEPQNDIQYQKTNSNKISKTYIVLIVVLIIVIGVLLTALVYRLTLKPETENIPPIAEKEHNYEDDDLSDSTENKKMKVNIYGYPFELPAHLKYIKLSNGIGAIDKNGSYIFDLSLENRKYEDIKSNLASFYESIKSDGYTIVGSKYEFKENREFLMIGIRSPKEQNTVIYYTPLTTDITIMGSIQGLSSNHYLIALDDIVQIITSNSNPSSFTPSSDIPNKIQINEDRFSSEIDAQPFIFE